jgi:hypothetical protein
MINKNEVIMKGIINRVENSRGSKVSRAPQSVVLDFPVSDFAATLAKPTTTNKDQPDLFDNKKMTITSNDRA